MKARLKPLGEQVIVITGASSGIGLATAVAAARAGARVVLAARSEHSLRRTAGQIEAEGGEALAVVCDVSERRQIDHVVDETVARFGRIDTWVNNAGVGIYGRLKECEEQDSRRVFDVNFWGVVNGSLAALPHLKRTRGALINIGSEVSEGYVPLLGIYTASKHAVKGFTDSLRVEIERVEQSPVSITLIQPSAVDTPFPQHARNYQPQEPKLPDPKIEAATVADAILHAATHRTRAKRVGLFAKINTTLVRVVPPLADRLAAKLSDRQHYDEPPRHPRGALHEASETATGVAGRTRGTGGRTVDDGAGPARRRSRE